MESKKIRTRFLSSFTAKIFALLLLVGAIPVVADAYLFEKVTSFNQELQVKAEESINDVNDVYRAWAAGVKTSHNAIRVLIRNDVEMLLKRHNIRSTDELLNSTAFKEDLKTRMERRVNETERLLTFEMNVDQKLYFKIDDNQAHPNMTTDSMFANIRLGEEDNMMRLPPMPPRPQEEDQEVLEATVDGEDVEAVSEVALPHTLPERAARERMFNAPIELTITVGYDSSITEAFEKLGERRGLHSSINAMENDQTTSLSTLYRNFFILVIAIVGLLVVCAGVLIVLPLSNQIQRLVKGTKRVSEGDLETQVEVRGNDQIAELTHQFNAMIKDLKSAQDNRAYIERMQAWQEVARRLAHEIKNPLTPMLLAMQQLDKKFDDYIENPKKYRRLLDDVMEIMNEEAATLQKLVKEFSSFARLPVPDRKSMNFFEFVSTTIEQNPQFSEDTKRLTVKEPAEALKAREAQLDKELMRRVIVNIVKNGIEAAQNAHIEPEIDVELREKPSDNGGKSALWLLIIDNGPGLTAEQKEKIFNPYFTTKSDGTGLGLVIVRKIVQDHDGDISLHDRDDGERGTQVDIILH